MSYIMSKLIGWKVWYSDGMEITSRTNKWIHIPMMHFQILKKFYDDKEPEIIVGTDLFCISSEPLIIQKLIQQDIRNIKVGEQILDALFFALSKIAKLDREVVSVMV